uniref:Uncharacterized protein n=1 Tax=Medicago truncatula TaxID=3880 RepID=I3S5U7_MEDTR|nr:unknown [Medicago truncatula]
MPSTISFKGDIVGYLASSQTNLVKYESTGTPSTVRPAVLTPETLSSSSI